MPFFVFPLAVIAAARVADRIPVAAKSPLVLPVALLIGLPNRGSIARCWYEMGGLQNKRRLDLAAFDRAASLLAAAAAIVLVAVTGFPAICGALERLGMPRPLAVQLLFLYRYLGRARRGGRAHDAPATQRGGGHPLSIRLYGTLVGRLLLRTWDRAERIYLAMCARGFTGDFRSGTPSRLRLAGHRVRRRGGARSSCCCAPRT